MDDRATKLFMSSRERHPAEVPARFIEKHVVLAGAPSTVYSEWSGSFISPEKAAEDAEERAALWKQADEEKDRLFALMEDVQRKLVKKKGEDKDQIDVRRCSWDQVMTEINRTALRWKNRPEKQGKTMVFIDKVGQHSAALEAWLELLPMGDYGSSICGVFKLAIGAAGQYSKTEEEIFAALAEIPDIMETARRYLDNYKDWRGQRFERRVCDLFRACLRTLRHIMQFFSEGRSRHFLDVTLKQTTYKNDLSESLAQMNKCVQEIRNEGLLCNSEVSVATYGNSREAVENTREAAENSREAVTVLKDFMEFLRAHPGLQLRQPNPSHATLTYSPYDWVNADRMAPLEDESIENKQKAQEKLKKQQEEMKQRVLESLQYDSEVLPRDIATCREFGHRLSDEAKARAAAMIHHERFKNFMEDAASSNSLLVNGREDASSTDDISPLSFVDAELTRLTESPTTDKAPVFVVNYFCAEHKPTSASRFGSSPLGMLASLNGQLLSQMSERGLPVDLSFLTERKLQKLRQSNPVALLSLFKKLMRQLPAGGVLFCIIDEIVLYESQMFREDTDVIIDNLVWMVNRQGSSRASFKLLVTCRDRALGVSTHFLGNTVDLQEYVEVDDSAGGAIAAMVTQAEEGMSSFASP